MRTTTNNNINHKMTGDCMLNSIKVKKEGTNYPFDMFTFGELMLNHNVIFFTGNNGSGKSTLLEAIAKLSNCIDLGNSLNQQYDYENFLNLSWSIKLKRGYYFKSEDFYLFLENAKSEQVTNEQFLANTEARHSNKSSLAYLLESGLHKGNIAAYTKIQDNYLKVSHGEGYINFFSERLRSNSLYLLDEPETPLSMQNQLTLISMIDEYVKQGSQFIICTHSPILLAYPDALIYDFNNEYEVVQYNDHYIVNEYRLFLENSDRFIHHLLK